MEITYLGQTFQGAHKFEATVNYVTVKMQYFGHSYAIARRLFRDYINTLK